MTDRLDEIRARAEAATPGPWEFDSHVHGEKGCRCLSHFVVTGYTLTNPFPCCDETAEAKGASDDCTSTVVTFEDATFIAHARDDIPYLLAEVERLRAALTDVSFRCERCGLDFAADGIDATNRCHQCHNDVHFGQPTVQWNPILDDIGNTTITQGGES